jgi:hypothetical protein
VTRATSAAGGKEESVLLFLHPNAVMHIKEAMSGGAREDAIDRTVMFNIHFAGLQLRRRSVRQMPPDDLANL